MLASYTLARLKLNDDDSDGVAIRAAIDKLKAQARRTSDGATYWAMETNTPFYGWGAAGRVETTALAVQALSEFENRNSKTESRNEVTTTDKSNADASELVRGGLLFLMRNKDEIGCWYSTQTTINVLDTLVTLLANEAANKNQKGVTDTLEILIDTAVVAKLDIPNSHEPLAPTTLNLARFIKSGTNKIRLRRATPNGFASAQLVSDFYVAWKPDAKQAERNTRVTTSHGQSEFEGLNSSSTLGLKVLFNKQAAKAGDEISCAVAIERTGFRGYGMMLAEIGLPPASDVDRASLDKAIVESGYALARYDVLPDRVVIYAYPQAGGTKFNFKFRPRYAMNAQSNLSQLYDHYNPEARVSLAPARFEVKDNDFPDYAVR